jgi:hypothetical protein
MNTDQANAGLICGLLFLVPAFANSSDCAPCHREIYDRYRRTAMARSSGATEGAFPEASFAGYRVHDNILEFDGAKKALPYFVGSGATARSYLIAAEGFLFEAPVALYSRTQKWDLAPGYEKYGYPYVTRPILPGCLTCHASFLQPVAGTQNGFRTPPFLEGGVACERCHGKSETHFLNPAKLSAERRDSVCSQCHLSGEVRVMRAGMDWQSYHPGDRLSDSVTAFLRAGARGMQVTSHVENLAQSRCKQASGDRLWCGTCHDPHGVPDAVEIRRKCAGCHVARPCKGDDCTGCHMPKGGVTDAQHVVYTDHSIPRRARASNGLSKDAELVAFGAKASGRDVGLAYAIAGQPGRAVKLLEEAERKASGDVEVLIYLAEIYRNGNQADRAEALYRRALRLDGSEVTAAVGLGAILFQKGRYREAIPLWEGALARNPGLDLTRTNLAMAQWQAGDLRSAEATLVKGLELSPGFRPAADLLRKLGAR